MPSSSHVYVYYTLYTIHYCLIGYVFQRFFRFKDISVYISGANSPGNICYHMCITSMCHQYAYIMCYASCEYTRYNMRIVYINTVYLHVLYIPPIRMYR